MKKLLVGGAGIAAGLGLASAGAAAYVAKMVQGRATGDIDGLLGRKDPDPREVVVCLGASIVRGRASVDFVEMLRTRIPQMQFVNGGVNNETANGILQRLDAVIACQPKAILILVGSNDAQAILNPSGAIAKRRQNAAGSTEAPSVETYQRDLQAIVAELVDRTGARIGLCSLPPLGQAIQDPVNDIVRQLNGAIRAVAENTGETYVPVYEQMVAYLESADATDGPAFTGDWRVGARSLSQHFIVGRSYDAIAEREGLLLSPDFIHLNTTGASIVADASAIFLAAKVVTSPYGDAIAATPTQAPADASVHAPEEQTVDPDPETVSPEVGADADAETQPTAPAEPLEEPKPRRPTAPVGLLEPASEVEPESAPRPTSGPSPYGE